MISIAPDYLYSMQKIVSRKKTGRKMAKGIPFTYEEFRKFIRYCKRIAPITSFRDYQGSNGILMRHDVDIDIRHAHALSEIEKDLGVCSTYFIMTGNPLYNPLSSGNRKLLNDMNDNGFEIGLHFDPMIYDDIDHEKLREKVRFECCLLENIINTQVRAISIHNPSVSNTIPVISGYLNAYSPEFFHGSYYISDSQKNFRNKDPYKFVEAAKSHVVQILLHPAHWGLTERSYLGICEEVLNGYCHRMEDIMAVNETFRKTIGDDSLIDCYKRTCK